MKTTLLLTTTFGGLLLLCGCHTASQSAVSAPPLIGTKWVLTELNGKPLVLSEGLQLPTLKLDAAKKQASGKSGINRFAGPYELDGTSLKFGLFMGTRMAGPPEAMAVEDAFLAAMREVRVWKISNQELELSGGGKPLLRFKASNRPDGTTKT